MLRKLVLAGALALASIGVAAGPAVAFTAVFSPGGEITMTSLGNVTIFGNVVDTECNLTLRGIFNRVITLTRGESLGQISSFVTRECESGTGVTPLVLNWAIRYREATGVLPDNGTRFTATIEMAFNISIFGGFVNCLYSGPVDASIPLTDTGTNTYRTGLVEFLSSALRLIRGSCAAVTELRGVLALTTQTVTIR